MLQNHAFFYVLASELLKNTRFSTFWPQNSSKTRVFPRFWLQNGAFFHVLASELLKNACFSMFLLSKWLKATCFPKFWFQHCSKTCVYQIFSLQTATAIRFSMFLVWRGSKNHAFFHVFCFKIFQCKVYFFTDRRLCTQVLRARKLLHTDALHTKAFTHRKSTHRLFCTTNCFTHISFCTPKHLNTSAFYRGF